MEAESGATHGKMGERGVKKMRKEAGATKRVG